MLNEFLRCEGELDDICGYIGGLNTISLNNRNTDFILKFDDIHLTKTINNIIGSEITIKRETKLPKAKLNSQKKHKSFFGSTTHVELPSLAPLTKADIPTITSETFLTALREENCVINPEIIHGNCYEAMDILKTNNILDKYVLNDDETAVLCAVPMLLDEGFSIQKLIKFCTVKTPSKLLIMMLIALRKLPRYRGQMYFEIKKIRKIKSRNKGSIIQPFFCIASKEMIIRNEKSNIDKSCREIFRVEEGWGYDISDFVITKDRSGNYCNLK